MVRLELPDNVIVDYARVTHNDSLLRQVLEFLHYLFKFVEGLRSLIAWRLPSAQATLKIRQILLYAVRNVACVHLSRFAGNVSNPPCAVDNLPGFLIYRMLRVFFKA
jgi:hypothetical protein